MLKQCQDCEYSTKFKDWLRLMSPPMQINKMSVSRCVPCEPQKTQGNLSFFCFKSNYVFDETNVGFGKGYLTHCLGCAE